MKKALFIFIAIISLVTASCSNNKIAFGGGEFGGGGASSTWSVND